MKYSIDDITKYVDSLDTEVRDILSETNINKLQQYATVDHSSHVTTYEFPNGYAVQYWYQQGAYAHDTYPIKNTTDVVSVDGVMQVQCWIHAWNVMNRPPHTSISTINTIIDNIRRSCHNIDDLRQLHTSIEHMIREYSGNCV